MRTKWKIYGKPKNELGTWLKQVTSLEFFD